MTDWREYDFEDQMREGYGDGHVQLPSLSDADLQEMGYCPVCGLLGACCLARTGVHDTDL